MSSSRQVFQSKVSSAVEGFGLPEIAVYVLNEKAARNILSIAQTVREKSLAVVEAHSTLVTYYAESGEALRVEDELPTQADRLCVTGDKFWFKAVLIGTDATITTESVSVSELAKRFGLEAANEEFLEYAAASPGI